MTPADLRILCMALGFTAVVMQGEKISRKDGALRAATFANLIEEFCRTTLPDIFDDEFDTSATAKESDVQHRMVTAIVQIFKQTGQCEAHDLKDKGFTQHEIALHWPMAYALAKVELKMMDS